MITYAADFESYYDKECSIKTLGPRGYFSHPDFDAYMLTVVGDNGFRYAGHPTKFDWTLFEGQTVVAHNASFDESLYLYGVGQGWYPKVNFDCHCTADMVAFLGLPRSLKNAAAAELGITITKTTRDNMCGKRWESMTEAFREEVTQYAIKDSELCLELWQKLNERWPERERAISKVNRKIGQRGLPIDADLLRKNLEVIKVKHFEAESAIPWIGEYTPLSRVAFNDYCRRQGITPPVSLAKDDPETDKWFEAHSKDCPWANSVRDWRRINAFLKKLESFDAGTMPDGRYYGNIMYCGANPTLRFSGSGGNLNLQNLPREEMFDVNLRRMIKPKAGRKLVVVDLSQIEVRTLFWWAGDTETLDLIRKSPDIYHPLGVMLGAHKDEDGPLSDFPNVRKRVKTMVLGCQFGLGGKGFAAYSGLPEDEAEAAVALYQSKMPSVIRLWKKLKTDIAMTCTLGQPLTVTLPSGRTMEYGTPRKMKTIGSDGKPRFADVGKMVRQGQKRDFRLWHGLLAENHAQALARDIFADMMVRVDAAGHDIILHVHDELVVEVDEADAEQALEDILRIMSTPPDWIPEIPVSAEGHICDLYTK